eukprot:PhF_6_TR8784/c0_g1_i2/m.13920
MSSPNVLPPAPLSTDYKPVHATQSALDARTKWFSADGGRGSNYPNWTFGKGSSSNVISPRSTGGGGGGLSTRTPTSLQTIPEDKPHRQTARGRSPARNPNGVQDIRGASPRQTHVRNTVTDPNWTLEHTPTRPMVLKTDYTNNNNDIEGSRPALTKFRKCNQRIVPDPYPDRGAAQRHFASHHVTRFSEKGFEGSESTAPPPSHTATHPNCTSNQESGESFLQLKRIEVFREGQYVAQSIVMENNAPKHSVGLNQSKGTRTDDIEQPHHRSRGNTPHASPATPRALKTDDISGAKSRGTRQFTNRPSLTLDVTDINSKSSPHRAGRAAS